MTDRYDTQIRDLLDDWRARLTPEQKAEHDKRRRILGSPEETAALNRYEGGAA